jgi:hypothetical protein
MESKLTLSDFLNPGSTNTNCFQTIDADDLLSFYSEFKKLENKYLALFLIFLEKHSKPDAIINAASHNRGKSYLEKHIYFQDLKEKCVLEFRKRQSIEKEI